MDFVATVTSTALFTTYAPAVCVRRYESGSAEWIQDSEMGAGGKRIFELGTPGCTLTTVYQYSDLRNGIRVHRHRGPYKKNVRALINS